MYKIVVYTDKISISDCNIFLLNVVCNTKNNIFVAICFNLYALIMIRENCIPENRSDFDERLDILFEELLCQKVKYNNNLDPVKVNACFNLLAGVDIIEFVTVAPESIVSVLKNNHLMSDASMERLADLLANTKMCFNPEIAGLLSERANIIYAYVDEQYRLVLKK